MEYFSVSDFYKQTFGTKVYKISIDAGCTCPNRDGTKGTGGCIFCSNNGSGDFVPNKNLSITEQIESAKQKVINKFSRNIQKKDIPTKYLVYFQNFTNTYGNTEALYSKYLEALNCKDVIGLCIGTRPDSIGQDLLEKLAKLSQTKYIQIELGLQTCNEETAMYINRCYKNQEYIDCIKKIHAASNKIHIVTHLIFGLPGETKKQMLESVKFAKENKTDGIKITNLYILKGTKLYKEYLDGKVYILNMEEYFELIKDALKIIGKDIVIHRLTGDGPKNLLVEPMWTCNKKLVLNSLKKYLESN